MGGNLSINDINTSDIDSEEADIFERKRNFDEVKRRLEEHTEASWRDSKHNDLRYNVYLRKMRKLA